MAGLGLAMQAGAFLDERVEDLGALALCLGKRAQAGQPDLLRRILDALGELALEQACR